MPHYHAARRTRHRHVLLWVAGALLCVAAACAQAPSVAFVSKQFHYLEEYDAAHGLLDAGFEVGVLRWTGITPESLRPFNAVVLTDVPIANERGEVLPHVSAAFAALHDYCKAGGGVLSCMGTGGWGNGRIAANVFLKPWDAELLDEQVTDPQNLYRQTRWIRWDYSWTTSLAPSPITEGLSTVFFPARSWRADGQKTLYAPKLGDAWTTLVRGEPSARSVRTVPNTGIMEQEAATYASEPPIAAIRDVEAGRAAILALWPNWTFWGARNRSMEGIVWESGANGLASDTGKLCVRLIEWLAEPSVENGAFGGYVTPESPETRPEEYVAQPVDWDTAKFPEPADLKHLKVLAGARTARTSGTGTVAEYCAAAKTAGYQAVLFAERLDELAPEEWNSLRDECAAASDAEFLALPGIDYTTLQGDEYVAFGEFDFPEPPGLAADGKRIDDTYNFWGSQMHHGFLAITRLHAHPERDPQILKNMTACAVHTYLDGELVDDSLDFYHQLDAQFHNLVPLALHLVSSPAAVSQAAETGLQNVWRVRDAVDLREQITPQKQAGLLYWMNPHFAYLTSGPKLEEWAGLNVMYWAPPAPGSDRWRMRLNVAAPAGVREVRVLDRGRPWLRFANDGPECVREWPGYHDRQHVFHFIATDADGGTLVSPGIRIRFSDAYVNQCGDHQNTISASLQRNRQGRMLYTSGTTLGVYAGWIPTWNAPCPVDHEADFPPAWDGEFTGKSGKAAVRAALDGGIDEGGEASSSTNLYDVAGPEVQILRQVVRSKYPEGTPRRKDCAPSYRTVPTEFIDYTVRRLTPTAKFERVGTSFVDVTVTAKQDLRFDPNNAVPLHGYAISDYGSRPEGVGDHCFVSFADGRSLNRVGTADARQWIAEGEMDLGNCVAAYPNPLGAGAVFPLTPVMAKVTLTSTLMAANFGLPLSGVTAKAGDEWTMRFIAVSAATSLEHGNQSFEDVRRSLGIGCDPGYGASVTRGQIDDTTGMLSASAADGAFAARLTKTPMPTELMVQVSGLTDGWTAAAQVDGGELQSITVHGGTGYTNLDLNQADISVAIGHPVTCDRADVRIVAWWGADGLDVFAHNPTENAIECTLGTNDAFAGLPAREERVTIPPGDSVQLAWEN